MTEYLNDLIAYENGELEDDAIIALFQRLINNGVVWQLQGCYGRQAKALIDSGECYIGDGT